MRVMNKSSYTNLMACYLSGQMSEAQFNMHCEDDQVFAVWAARRLVELRRSKAV